MSQRRQPYQRHELHDLIVEINKENYSGIQTHIDKNMNLSHVSIISFLDRIKKNHIITKQLFLNKVYKLSKNEDYFKRQLYENLIDNLTDFDFLKDPWWRHQLKHSNIKFPPWNKDSREKVNHIQKYLNEVHLQKQFLINEHKDGICKNIIDHIIIEFI